MSQSLNLPGVHTREKPQIARQGRLKPKGPKSRLGHPIGPNPRHVSLLPSPIEEALPADRVPARTRLANAYADDGTLVLITE